MTPPPPRLAEAVRAGEAGAAAAQTYVRSHGAALAPFVELVARFGKAALNDVVLLHQILGAPEAILAESALESGWAAAKRLLELAGKVPDEAARVRAGIDVQRSMLALLSRQEDFAVSWTETITKAVLEGRGALADEALKLAPQLAKSTAELVGAKTLARLSADLPGASAELRGLWALLLKAVPQTDAGLLKAANLAAESAEPVRALLRRRGIRSTERFSRLWGYLSAVRGAAGEAHALHDAVWLAVKSDELLRAHKLAVALGPGFEVRYLTQAENLLMLNGREGPDAVIALVNRSRHELIDVTRAQVKIATLSEGAGQSANDLWRLIGQERAAAAGLPAVYTLTIDGVTESFVATARADVVPRIVLLNAAGSRIPKADLDVLAALGLEVTEGGLSLTVRQYTHLAISMIESAIKNL